jgi:tetratricopeptide (TPR) repeat protein
MKGLLLSSAMLLASMISFAQGPAKVREYMKTFKTYPFSDPDPVPEVGKVYPYYRFDGYTDHPVNKEWKVVELENDYIKVMILPEIGGKIWAAIEKSTGKSFIYYNHVVKFRDVAMRGPWTSGGIEANYGIVGHTPNCATPVDYVTMEKPDGSVSCVIGVLDLLTRTTWRIDINLQKDKAFFTTASTWYNGSTFEQPYYTWMNTGIKSDGNLQFIYPGTRYIGHAGEYSNWPIDDKGRDLSYYNNNDFGEYKSYHVFGKYTNFFGGYYHDEDFGMARYSSYDDKPGKKIWIWGLSRQGMIWEKLLTDDDGQYVEVQSGRLFNQAAEGSSFTPFKNRGFIPNATDTWKEYWMPVMKTKGFVIANNYGSLNLKKSGNRLVVYFCPVQPVNDEIQITDGNKTIYSKQLNLKTLQVFADSLEFDGNAGNLKVTLGDDKLNYEAAPEAGNLSRPVQTPEDFDWNSVQGLHLRGREFIKMRMYTPAEEKLRAALKADHNYLPALADLSLLLYRQMKYKEALEVAKRALSIDTYDAEANYYYGLINEQLGKITDAKDGLDIATQSAEYRSAANLRLANIYFKEGDFSKVAHYASRSIEANKYSMGAYQLLAVMLRKENKKAEAMKLLDSIATMDPLNHFVNFERYRWDSAEANKNRLTGMVRNEMPAQTYLELAAWFYNAGLNDEALRVLSVAPSDEPEIAYWKAFLSGAQLNGGDLKPGIMFPFRNETATILEKLVAANDNWLLKYHLALVRWNSNDIASAKKLFEECGEKPAYAPFYAARAKLYADDSTMVLTSIEKAKSLDANQWRYDRALINYYLQHNQLAKAGSLSAAAIKKFPDNYILGMLHAKVLIAGKQYAAADKFLDKLNVLPNEGSTSGRLLYREAKIMLARQSVASGNCKKALQYLQQAREWPEHLGSGKPYEDDVDERPEDWLSYQCLQKSNKKAAAEMLDKILTYTTHIDTERRPSVNNLVSAWALKEAGKEEEGRQLLQKVIDKHPSNAVAKWALAAFTGEKAEVPEQVLNDDNYQFVRKY